jgi:murein DD-endopeptidase MepM/ murein hydrolase activator NlpD
MRSLAKTLLPLLVVPLLAAPSATADDAPSIAPNAAPSPPSAATLAAASVELGAQNLEGKIGLLDRDIASAKHELETVGPAKLAATTRAKLRGRRLYKLTRAGLLPLGGGFSAFVDHAQQVERLRRALKADLDEQDRLGSRSQTLVAALSSMTKERAELADRKALVDAAKVAIDEERHRREAFERAFAESRAPRASRERSDGDNEIVVYGPTGKSVPEGEGRGSFVSRKGRLTFPVAGEAEVRDAMHDGGPAVEIKAPLGATVRAVHAGRVAFADRYGTYGSLVILDHGDRCWSVSGNLGSLDVKVGDEISAGERIGTVGDDGRGASLYFELRIGEARVPPRPWLGL